MYRRTRLLWSLGLSLSVLIAKTAVAQVHLEIGPLAAAYAPLGTFKYSAVSATNLPLRAGDLSGLAWGLQGRLWLSARLGVQLQATAASSRFGGGVNTPGGFVTEPAHAQVVTLTAQAMYRPVRAFQPLWLSAGAGVVRHTGDAYAPYGSPSPLAAVLGLGVDAHVGSHVAATLGVTSFFYSLDFTDSHVTFNYGGQADVLAYIGMAWRSPLD